MAALQKLSGESAVREEMAEIRMRHACGAASSDDYARYRQLWVGLALRWSSAGRGLPAEAGGTLERFRQAREAWQQEHARLAVEAAFGSEDDATTGGFAPQPG